MFPTALEKEEACFGATSWLCVARVDGTAQAPVSDLFPFVSDRARIERGSVLWSSELDLRGQRKGTSTGAVSECAGMKRGSVLWKRYIGFAWPVWGEPAQALVSNMFPLVSNRAAVRRGSVLWSRVLDLRGRCT